MSAEMTLSDIANITMGQSPKKNDVNEIRDGYPLLNGPTEFTNHYPEPVQFTTNGNRFSKNGDILFCVRGSTTGKMNYSDQTYAIGRGIAAIRGINGYPTPFIKAVIEYNLNRLLVAATGSTFPNVSKALINDFKIKVISPKEAQKANELMVSLEQKIHLNQQMNETLEAMAQAIFKSWFVDFDPVHAKIKAKADGQDPNGATMAAIAGVSLEQTWDEIEADLQHKLRRMSEEQRTQLQTTAKLFPDELVDSELGEIPKGWEVKALDKVADFLNGHAMQKYPPEDGKPTLPVLKIAQLRKGDTEGADIATADIPERFKVFNGDMIFSWSGSLLIDIWAGGEAALNQHLFKVTSEKYDQWLYYYWTKHHLDNFIHIAESKAVTMGHINRSHLKEAKCAIPLKDLLDFGKNNIEPLLAKALELKVESSVLSDLRDTLLPKLISGEIRV